MEGFMRILVVGAGALGGYFGGRLVQAERDVTFMVRPHRAAQLARDGLRITSPHGDFEVPARTVLAGEVRSQFDLILVAVKSYSLAEATDQLGPAIGPESAILPVVNGIQHIDSLSARFGANRVLGGMAIISAALDAEGHIIQLAPFHELVFGELSGGFSGRIRRLTAVLEGAGFEARASEVVVLEMWEKWAGLAVIAGITCLMRASIGDIVAAPGGRDAIVRLLAESCAVAEASGFSPRPAFVERCKDLFTQAGSPLKASMLRDIERGSATEGEHVLGDMVARARAVGIEAPILELARCHVAAYESSRAR
jgi:2-dehydropantoate 2-reductase